ncbi:uncharacterized protein [Haliotis asinina]|uniref:uncharacterized protein n=1 Tax=Haliotis asinina TaxID=109174 RepID=UPI00353240DA
MSDNTIIAIVIVVAVVVLAVVMIVMLCQKSKAEAENKLNARRRQQRRNSRMIGRAFSHKYFNPFGEAKTHPDSHSNSHSHNNDDNNGDSAISDHGQTVEESPVFVVDNVSESRGSLGNVHNPTDSRHPHRIIATHPVPRSHKTVTHTLQVPTLPEYAPLSTSGELERYDYVPQPLPPIDAAPQQGRYNNPNESRGNEH